MKNRKTRILIILVVAFIGVYFGFKGLVSYIETNHQKQVAAITIANVDISKINDGIYTGSYKVFPVEVEVKVAVKDHKITEIQLLKHRNGQGTPAEIIPGKIIEAQTLAVDVVSGATSSSKVILKAIETALKSANN